MINMNSLVRLKHHLKMEREMRLLYALLMISFLTGCATVSGDAEIAKGSTTIDFSEAKSETNLIITYTARITITSKDIIKTLESIKTNFSKYHGYVIDERINETYINITYKVRTEEINAFMDIIASNYNLKSSSIYSTDITNEYYDTQIRLENHQKTRERFIQLLDKALTVTEIVEIEKELNRINEEIDILEGNMKRLTNLKDYSEISISIEKRRTPGPIGWIFWGVYKVISWLFIW